MKIIKFDWKPLLALNKYFGKKHSHDQEKQRRRKQIKTGQLKIQNGLEPK